MFNIIRKGDVVKEKGYDRLGVVTYKFLLNFGVCNDIFYVIDFGIYKKELTKSSIKKINNKKDVERFFLERFKDV